MAMHVGVGLVVIITKIHRWDESAMFFDGGSLGERCPIQYLHPPPFTLYSVARPRALTWTYVAWAWILFTRSTPYLSDGKLSSRCLAAFAGPHLPTPLRISRTSDAARLPAGEGLVCVDQDRVPMYDDHVRLPLRALS